MAEFCLECFNKFNDMKLTEKDVILGEDFCEGCSQIKPCIISIGKSTKKPFKSFFRWLGIE